MRAFARINNFKLDKNSIIVFKMKFLEYIFPKGQWSITRVVILFILFMILDFIAIYYKIL